MPQADIAKAFEDKRGDVYVVWAPYLYLLLARGGKVLANGKTAGVTVPGALVAAPAFAREHPHMVARFLRVYSKGLEWQSARRTAAFEMVASVAEEVGVKLHKRWFEQGFSTRPVWRLPGQLQLLARVDSRRSIADEWFAAVGQYLVGTGATEINPDPRTYITDEYMNR